MLFHTLQRMSALGTTRAALVCLLATSAMTAAAKAEAAPTFAISQAGSSIKFFVSASMSVSGTFKTWDATLAFASTDASTGVLDIKIQAGSVDTGSGMKDRTLKGEDFFDVANSPQIRFHSTSITSTGPGTFEMLGDFTIRGVTKPEKLMLTVSGAGTGSGTIKGTMSFNRKDYGINGSIPLVHIADRVDVTVDLKATRVSGPALTLRK
jgi:polyisoprenoid-binding protein YceI